MLLMIINQVSLWSGVSGVSGVSAVSLRSGSIGSVNSPERIMNQDYDGSDCANCQMRLPSRYGKRLSYNNNNNDHQEDGEEEQQQQQQQHHQQQLFDQRSKQLFFKNKNRSKQNVMALGQSLFELLKNKNNQFNLT